MFTSKYRQSSYEGLLENASAGLHAHAFGLFREYVSAGAKVLDLGSSPGAWVKRLHDASYAVTACDFTAPKEKFEFPYYQLDLNQNFATRFESEAFDAVCIVKVIEHLENPRHTFRQIKLLLKKGGVVFLITLMPQDCSHDSDSFHPSNGDVHRQRLC